MPPPSNQFLPTRPIDWTAPPPYQRDRQTPQPTPPPRPARPTAPLMVTMTIVGLLVLTLAGTGLGVVIGLSLPEAAGARTPPAGRATTGPTPVVSPTPTPTPSRARTPSESTASTSASPSSGREVYADLPQVVANRLYELEPSSLECRGLTLPVPEGKRLERWTEKALACLQRHYEPLVTEAGYTLSTPTLVFFTDEVDTPCGDGATGAFYCAVDEGIYVQRGIYVSDAGRLNTVRMLLHEYSHHVQNRVGILGDDKYGREPVPVISRRIELQASCWTAMQLRGSHWLDWSDQDEQWLEQFNSVDSDEMHGQARTRHHWYRKSLGGSTLATCNTWLATRDQVA